MSNEAPKRPFDMTINLGHVLVIATMLASLIGSYYVSGWRQDALERQVTAIQLKLDGFSSLLVAAAVGEQRIKELERRVEMIERR